MATEIILDAGHGGFDNGATYADRAEKDEVLRLTLAVGKMLEEAGYTVKYIRTEDIYESPYQKAAEANETGGDVFISFHRNSSVEENQYNGVQALVYSMDSLEAVELGESINEQLAQVGFKNLGIEAVPELIVLRRTEMPAVLMEVGFINSDIDNQIFDEKFDQIVQAIVSGIENVLPVGVQQQSVPRAFYVQTGLFKYDVNAAYQLERLQMLGYEGTIHYEKPYYGVWVGGVDSLDEAAQVQEQLRDHGYQTLIMTE